MRVTFAPEVRLEFAEAARWNAGEAGAQRAEDFRNAAHRTVALAAEHPAMGTPAAADTRRIVIHHYPYSIFYWAAGDVLRILAIAHHSRRPFYWAGRR